MIFQYLESTLRILLFVAMSDKLSSCQAGTTFVKTVCIILVNRSIRNSFFSRFKSIKKKTLKIWINSSTLSLSHRCIMKHVESQQNSTYKTGEADNTKRKWGNQSHSRSSWLPDFPCPNVTQRVATPPPPSTLIEPGGTFARSRSPEPLSQVLVTIGNYKKHPLFRAFSGNLPETPAKIIPPFPRKWECACGPLVHSRGGGGGDATPLTFISIPLRYQNKSRPNLCFNIPCWGIN